MNNRGVSMIVSTMIIILLVIVAIGIVWFVARGVLQGGADEVSLGKFLIDLEIKKAYVDDGDSNLVHVTVERGGGEGVLKGINFVFSNDEESKTVQEMVSLKQLESKTFDINIGSLGILATEVSIVPVYESDTGKEKLGGVLDTAILGEEAGVEGGGPVCGNLICEPPTETEENCDDCVPGAVTCGDGVCEGDETIYNCPADCEVPASCDGTWTNPGFCTVGGIYPCTELADCDPSVGGPGGTCGEDDNVECETIGIGCLDTCKCDRSIAYVPNDPYVIDCRIEDPFWEEPAPEQGISSVWPGSAPKYFDADGLPRDGGELSLLIGKYVNFTDSLSVPREGCYQIEMALYVLEPPYDMSHIRFAEVGPMDAGDSFQVWSSACCGDPTNCP